MSPKEKNIGGVWNGISKGGKPYLSISIEIDGEKRGFIAFANSFKQNERQPDYHVFPKGEGAFSPRQEYNRRQAVKQEEEPPADDFPGENDAPPDEDIPF